MDQFQFKIFNDERWQPIKFFPQIFWHFQTLWLQLWIAGFELADINKLVEKVFNKTPKFWLCLFSWKMNHPMLQTNIQKIFGWFLWEGVGTSKITTSKGQNVESFFWLIRTLKVKKSERRKYFQNVKNHFVKKNVESQRMLDFWRSENVWRHRWNQNVESLICLIFKFWWSFNYLWQKYLWPFGVKNQS